LREEVVLVIRLKSSSCANYPETAEETQKATK
jgi:hypothetical protein